MSQQYINIGAQPNDGLGDPIRTAFEKTNENFTQLYAETGNISNVIAITGNGISVTGNITTGNYFIGNGSLLTGISGGNGGNANTGNVTFDNVNVIGTGNLNLQPDVNNAGAYLDIYLTTGPDIHIAGNGESVILGTDDYANVTVNANGNVYIQASTGSSPSTWNFNSSGSLIFPRDTSNVSTDPYLEIVGGTEPSIVSTDVSQAGPANLSIVANYINFSASTAEMSIHPDDGTITADTGVTLTSNANGNTYSWTFDTVGNLTAPGDISANGNVYGNVISTIGNIYALDINLTGNVYGNNGNLIFYANAAQPELGWLISNDNPAYAGPNNSALVTPLSDDIHVGEILFQATTGTAITTFAGPNNGPFSNAFNIISTANILLTTQDLANSSGNIMYYDISGNLTIPNSVISTGPLVTAPVPLANLTAVAGGRAFIDDGNLVAASNFGAQVGNGGSNVVPVWSDGSNWYIG